MRKISLFFFFTVFFGLVSCKTESNPITVSPEASVPSEYPPPIDPSNDTSYPGPAFLTPVVVDDLPLSDKLDVPEPTDGTAIIYGQFVVNNAAGNAYLLGDIYLAPVIYSDGDVQFPFISLDVEKDIVANYRTKDHHFLFVDVLPGTYGIVIHTPVNDYVVPDETEGFLFIEIAEGDIIDLGTIIIE
jgi:hypothetical protein